MSKENTISLDIISIKAIIQAIDSIPAGKVPMGGIRKCQALVDVLEKVWKANKHSIEDAAKEINALNAKGDRAGAEAKDKEIFRTYLDLPLPFTLDPELKNFFKTNSKAFLEKIENQRIYIHILDAFGLEE